MDAHWALKNAYEIAKNIERWSFKTLTVLHDNLIYHDNFPFKLHIRQRLQYHANVTFQARE